MSTYIQPRQFFPPVWSRGNVPADADLDIGLTGSSWAKEFPAPRQLSVVTLVLVGSAVPTTGWIRAEITKDGVGTGYTSQFGQSTGTMRRIETIAPGALLFNREHRIGIKITSHASLAPTTIDVVAYVEVQPV